MLFYPKQELGLLFNPNPNNPNPNNPNPNNPNPNNLPYPTVLRMRSAIRITAPKTRDVDGFNPEFPFVHFWFSQKGITFWDCRLINSAFGGSQKIELIERKINIDSVRFFTESICKIPDKEIGKDRKRKLFYQLALYADNPSLRALLESLPSDGRDYIRYVQEMRKEKNPSKRLDLIRDRNKVAPLTPTRTYHAVVDTEYQAKGLVLEYLAANIQAEISRDNTAVVIVKPLRDERSKARQIANLHNASSYKADVV